ncbi:sulfite oxidase-like [Haliotis rufescens]|uniref:sulfite oxidase-like n=1 Tax=Haliotis rufescens TaxID=6454 RepID=UPI00201E9292|nr:sulfite oxidase-like [Haliotis rufescens]
MAFNQVRLRGGHILLAYSGRVTSAMVHSVPQSRDRGGERHASSANSQNTSSNRLKWLALGSAAAIGAGLYLKYKSSQNVVSAATTVHTPAIQSGPGSMRSDLPLFTEDQVLQHNSRQNGIWVTFKNGVYDITEYVAQHPGGSKIMMGAGKSIEPFWDLYGVHKNPEILHILEKHRIGNIVLVEDKSKGKTNDPYANDPKRSPVLIPSSSRPFNGEPPTTILVDNYITPNELFFVRNHLPVPKVDANKYRLEMAVDKSSVKLNLSDLKAKFKAQSVTSVVQCAGNRRSEMTKIKQVKGLNWNNAAISNATWTGVTLNDLLKHSGIDLEKVECQHVQFEGMDKGPEGAPYGASIPIDLARSLKDDIIIAYEMNGKDIPLDHGYPVRVIIPGVVGARQVKWLTRIVMSDEESLCHWQRKDYKGFNSSIDWHNVDFDKSVAIQQLPITSAICDPPEGAELEEGAEEVTLKGYAWSGGGRGVVRVDVSADGGQTWEEAELQSNNQPAYKSWAWTLWEATIPLPKDHKGKVDLVCKAVDVSYNVQPDNVDGVWNLRGVLNNAWHRVSVSVPPEEQS